MSLRLIWCISGDAFYEMLLLLLTKKSFAEAGRGGVWNSLERAGWQDTFRVKLQKRLREPIL